jgi:hypothetical protein
MGIEPTSEAWEASILPLNYARSGNSETDYTQGRAGWYRRAAKACAHGYAMQTI